jgi:uncharacterized protein YeaO (DUF488 family)
MHTLKSAIIPLLISSVILTTNALLAEDFKTIDGKEYKNVTVSRVEPDGIMLTSSSGISKVYFTELPKDVQERFHHDPAKAAAYSAEQNARLEALQKQQEEVMRKRAEAAETNNRYAAQQLAADESAESKRNTLQGLQVRYQELQRQEDDLLLRIGEAERPGSWGLSGRHHYYVRNGLADQLPYLRSHLNDVRHEKVEVRKRIEQAQH